MNTSMKQGALLFFGKANCVSCHRVSGRSTEMFSDFETHVIAVPQIVRRVTNAIFDGPGQNEDFGLEQVTGNPADRYKFRTSPLRNIALQTTFFHNGAFTSLENAIEHHLDVNKSVKHYRPSHHVAADLAGPIGPMAPVLARLDKTLQKPTKLQHDIMPGRPHWQNSMSSLLTCGCRLNIHHDSVELPAATGSAAICNPTSPGHNFARSVSGARIQFNSVSFFQRDSVGADSGGCLLVTLRRHQQQVFGMFDRTCPFAGLVDDR